MELGLTPVEKIARNRKIPRRTLYRWYNKYKKFGKEGLINKPTGSKQLVLNQKCGTLMRFSSSNRNIL